MKFIVTFELVPGTRNQAINRFLETGGMPPKGATFLGRWLRADFSGGYVLVESDDPKLMAEFALQWTDLIEIRVYPVLEDPEVIDVLKRRK